MYVGAFLEAGMNSLHFISLQVLKIRQQVVNVVTSLLKTINCMAHYLLCKNSFAIVVVMEKDSDRRCVRVCVCVGVCVCVFVCVCV